MSALCQKRTYAVQQKERYLITRSGNPCFLQAFEEPLLISQSRERPNKSLNEVLREITKNEWLCAVMRTRLPERRTLPSTT